MGIRKATFQIDRINVFQIQSHSSEHMYAYFSRSPHLPKKSSLKTTTKPSSLYKLTIVIQHSKVVG